MHNSSVALWKKSPLFAWLVHSMLRKCF